jgi:hypothetical protein
MVAVTALVVATVERFRMADIVELLADADLIACISSDIRAYQSSSPMHVHRLGVECEIESAPRIRLEVICEIDMAGRLLTRLK